MGEKHSKQEQNSDSDKVVNFSSFDVLRSIGKGSFGKVCIVRKKNTPDKVFAMKYMNKLSSLQQGCIENILKELLILSKLQHPFLVNLWFTFQDEEDIFMVSDLLLGGDLRYHINKHVTFSQDNIRIFLWEMGSVLDYLKSQHIVHRDIKPDNLLMDEKGHLHLTDFNIATVLNDSHKRSTSFAGTLPYTAPEIHQSALGLNDGYDYSVDWWSLGVTIYEIMRRKRPFDIKSDLSHSDVVELLGQCSISVPVNWPQSLQHLFFMLFEFNPEKRITSFNALCLMEFCKGGDIENVNSCKLNPEFKPSATNLNYDPTYELEEMIIESNPLHKKKQRLLKHQKSKEKLRKKTSRSQSGEIEETPEEKALRDIDELFTPFNREKLDEEKFKSSTIISNNDEETGAFHEADETS